METCTIIQGLYICESAHPNEHFPHSYVWYYLTMHCVNCVYSVGLWLLVPWASPLLLWLHDPLTQLVPLVPQPVPMEEIV